MNLKNNPKERAYVKIILPRTLLPYKSARGNKLALYIQADKRKVCKKNLTLTLNAQAQAVYNAFSFYFKAG